MITRLKISRSATAILGTRYAGLKLYFTPNIIVRNAMMFSINSKDIYNNEEVGTVGGTEFQISTLLGSKVRIYELLLNQYYGKKLTDDELKDIMSFHIDKGLRDPEFEKTLKY